MYAGEGDFADIAHQSRNGEKIWATKLGGQGSGPRAPRSAQWDQITNHFL